MQQVARFSAVFGPPFDTGVMWSSMAVSALSRRAVECGGEARRGGADAHQATTSAGSCSGSCSQAGSCSERFRKNFGSEAKY